MCLHGKSMHGSVEIRGAVEGTAFHLLVDRGLVPRRDGIVLGDGDLRPDIPEMFLLVLMAPRVTHREASMKFWPASSFGSGANCPNPSSAGGLGNMFAEAEHEVG